MHTLVRGQAAVKANSGLQKTHLLLNCPHETFQLVLRNSEQ